MVRYFALIAALLLAACGEKKDNPVYQEVLADEIEAKVSIALPKIDFTNYSKHYAVNENGTVSALFYKTLKVEKFGQRYWTKPENRLLVLDGGCHVVNVEYNPKAKALLSASCNGDA